MKRWEVMKSRENTWEVMRRHKTSWKKLWEAVRRWEDEKTWEQMRSHVSEWCEDRSKQKLLETHRHTHIRNPSHIFSQCLCSSSSSGAQSAFHVYRKCPHSSWNLLVVQLFYCLVFTPTSSASVPQSGFEFFVTSSRYTDTSVMSGVQKSSLIHKETNHLWTKKFRTESFIKIKK